MIDEPLAGGQFFPTPSQTYMIALILGLGLPIGIIFLLGLLQFKIQTRSDVERLTNLPIVGDIPLTPETAEGAIVVRENRNELMEEVFRSVRTQYPIHAPGRTKGDTLHLYHFRAKERALRPVTWPAVWPLWAKKSLLWGWTSVSPD